MQGMMIFKIFLSYLIETLQIAKKWIQIKKKKVPWNTKLQIAVFDDNQN